MKTFQADYFDGLSARKHPATVMLARGRMKIVGQEISEEVDAPQVRCSARIAGTPRWLYLPGGGACVTADNDAVDAMLHPRRYERALHRWESRPVFSVLSIALVVVALWLLIDRGLPAAAETVAARVPVEAEEILGRETLAGMDRYFLQPSKLHARRQEALRAKLTAMSQAAGVSVPYRLEFRSSAIGPNAFALPSGIIVMTDELVNLAKNDQEVLAVLAHELGHLHHRHSMRRLLESSATALIIAAVTGDVASATSLAAAAPMLLVRTKYSRDNERQADRYAIEVMRKAGLEPRALGTLLARLERDFGGTVPQFLSTHPDTEERKAIAGVSGVDIEGDEERDDEPTAELVPERPRLAAIDPAHQGVLALLERRDFAGLERLLGEQQRAFERDSSESAKLEHAFRSFAKVPRALEPALDEWVEKSPDSYVARVGRASYYLYQGIDARGTTWSRDTPAENKQALRFFHDKARADLARSLGLSEKPYQSHVYLMAVALHKAARAEGDRHYEAAVKLAPQSVELRLRRMYSLEPRWGGSYRQMEAFVKQARVELKDPAAVDRIAARVPAYRGFERKHAKDWHGALKHYTDSLALYDNPDTVCERADVLEELGREAEAFAEVKRGLAKDRENRYCLRRAVYYAERTSDTEEAIRVLTSVLEVDPQSAPALNQRGWKYHQRDNLEAAFRDYHASAQAGDAWGQLQTGKFYWHGHGVPADRDQAVAWLQKSAAQGNRDAKVSLGQAMQIIKKERPTAGRFDAEGAARP